MRPADHAGYTENSSQRTAKIFKKNIREVKDMGRLSEGVYIEGFMKGFGQRFDRGFKPYETLMVQLTRYQCVRNLMKNGKRSIDESMDILKIPEDNRATISRMARRRNEKRRDESFRFCLLICSSCPACQPHARNRSPSIHPEKFPGSAHPASRAAHPARSPFHTDIREYLPAYP